MALKEDADWRLDLNARPPHPATQCATTNPPPKKKAKPYSTALLPLFDKKRKSKGTFCQRLARNLDRYDESPGVYDASQRQPLPPILKLPAEIRQQILFFALDDEEVMYPRPNSKTMDMALVCKTFAGDGRKVTKLWDARERELRRGYGTQQSELNTLMADLLRPVQAASAVLTARSKLRRQNSDRRDQPAPQTANEVRYRKQNLLEPNEMLKIRYKDKSLRTPAEMEMLKEAKRADKKARKMEKRFKYQEAKARAQINHEKMYGEWAEKNPEKVALVEKRRAYMGWGPAVRRFIKKRSGSRHDTFSRKF